MDGRDTVDLTQSDRFMLKSLLAYMFSARILRFSGFACLVAAGCATLSAQSAASTSGHSIDLMSLFSLSSMVVAGSGLIAWGKHTEKASDYARRLSILEKDRVTRRDLSELQRSIHIIQADIKLLLERRRRDRLPADDGEMDQS